MVDPAEGVFDAGLDAAPAELRVDKLVTAAKPPPAVSGGTLAISPDGAFAVAADSDRDRVDIVDLSTRALVGTVQLESGSEPGRVVVDGSGMAHVALRGGGVALIDVEKAALIETTPACRHPRGLALDAEQNVLYVSCLGGSVLQLSASDHAPLQSAQVVEDLRDVLVTSQGLYVSRYRQAELLKLDGELGIASTERPVLGDPSFLNGVAMLDAGVGDLSDLPLDGFFTPRDPTLASRTVVSGELLVMLHQGAVQIPVSPAPGGYGGGDGCGSAIATPAVTIKRLGETMRNGVSLSSGSVPVDLAISPDGSRVVVAAYGEWLTFGSTLQVFSLGTLDGGQVSDAGVPPVPGCAFPDSSIAGPGRTVAVAFGPDGTLYALSREPHVLAAYGVGAVADGAELFQLALGGESVEDTAHDLFHGNVGQGIACASCHGELTDDGHVWMFDGIGPRRTQNMRGGLLGTEPFHWSGDMADFHALVDDVMVGRMGGAPQDDTIEAAMGDWIDQQPALVLEAIDAEAAARGKLLFESSEVGCATCHSGPKGTNNTSVDVGTGGVFQVPTLMGVGWRAPYMHDGCAETLHDRFDPACGGGDQHGTTSQLSETEIDDLVAYLRSL